MPRNRKRQMVRDAKAAAYRRLILKAGEEIFSRLGYADAKVRDIAAEAGISLTTFYALFASKQELFAAIGEARQEKLTEDLRATMTSASSPELALEAAIETTVRFYAERPALLQVLLRDGRNWAEDTSLPERERESWRAGILEFRSLFARGRKAGVFVDVDPMLLAKLVAGILQVHLAHWLDQGQGSLPTLVSRVKTFVSSACCRHDR